MIEPASPLPWKRDVRAPRFLYRRDGYNVGNFLHPQDAGYAQHAANCFPALLAALKELADATAAEVNEKGGGGYVLARLADARAAIATADPGTGDSE